MSLVSAPTCRLLDIVEPIAPSVSLDVGTRLIMFADKCGVTAGPVWHASREGKAHSSAWADGAVGHAKEAVTVSLH